MHLTVFRSREVPEKPSYRPISVSGGGGEHSGRSDTPGFSGRAATHLRHDRHALTTLSVRRPPQVRMFIPREAGVGKSRLSLPILSFKEWAPS